MSNTPEPWSVAEESFDNYGIHESVIRGLDGRAAIAVTLDFGPNNPAMREANARRIVACVNACAGIEDPSNYIPSIVRSNESLMRKLSRMENQRNELLESLEKAVKDFEYIRNKLDGDPHCSVTLAIMQMDDAIFKAKGGA